MDVNREKNLPKDWKLQKGSGIMNISINHAEEDPSC